ncbi:M1 family metallopeptidase [Flavobacterium sp. CYK-4]|uniref:M1 family metallopeptidase n=1 Tax=Flavobacterium lotistagni TaxID=2709660 RepID=UPI00140CB926|nr:M1 family metallopeptidase [Flavobacterium lotistagni]NHM06217.1 M1 family metallopeptidase [Flavobacterium lotistagni]
MRYYLLLLFTSIVLGQQTRWVDFKTLQAQLEINPVKRNVKGNITYNFEVNQKVDTIRIDAQKMTFSDVRINGKPVAYKDNKKQLLLFDGFDLGSNVLTFTYEAFPTQAMYFVNWDFNQKIVAPEEVQGQIWTQGQGKYTSHWLPSFDDVNEKIIFSLEVTFHKSFTVISNGDLVKKEAKGNNLVWSYRMSQPMSSYLVMLAIGHFSKQQTTTKSLTPLEFYYEAEDQKNLEPTYRYSREIFDYLESKIGVPYPWKIYRQVPVRDFLYAGMENTTATVFARDFIVDSIAYNDRNYLNVNAHELAHQWFGDLVTAKSGKDHWLQEGFATYYALLAEKSVFGENYFYHKVYNISRQILEASKTDTIPVLNEKASSLSFYQKGALALFVLNESIGDEKFDLAVKNYLNKYAYQNVTTDDFLNEVNQVALFNTAFFKKRWLESAEFPAEDMSLLRNNKFLDQYLELQRNPLSVTKDKAAILALMQSDAYYPIKEMLVFQTASQRFEDKEFLLDAALKTGEIHVRQAVANSLTKIPESFRERYETLLNDPSYETQEAALFNLWKQFPAEQKRYIDLSKNWVGFQDQNLKLLHLYLAHLTTSDPKQKVKIYLKLLAFTGTNYDSNIQQQALQKLLNLQIYTEDVFRGLAYGIAHHRWQYVKFCKDNIRKLIKEDKHRATFNLILGQLPIREKTHLQRLLNEK